MNAFAVIRDSLLLDRRFEVTLDIIERVVEDNQHQLINDNESLLINMILELDEEHINNVYQALLKKSSWMWSDL